VSYSSTSLEDDATIVLQKELTILKDLFTAHANGTAASVSSNNMNTNRSFHQVCLYIQV